MRNYQNLENLYLQTAENLGWKIEESDHDLGLVITLASGNNFGFVATKKGLITIIRDFLFDLPPDDYCRFYSKEESESISSELDKLLNALAFTNINDRPFDPLSDELPDYRKMVNTRIQDELWEFIKKQKEDKESFHKNLDRLSIYAEATRYLLNTRKFDTFTPFDFGILSKHKENILEHLYNVQQENDGSEWERDSFIIELLGTAIEENE